MKDNMTFLVATDYSKEVMNAERYAVQMALATGATIRFLHVFAPAVMDQVGSFDAGKIDKGALHVELERLQIHVRQLLGRLDLKPGQLNYECLVREGDPATQIVEESNDTIPDFILMGAHGGSGFREWLLGSSTWQVIKTSTVPVWVLPKDALFTGIHNIVFATEYREGELPVLNYITRFADRFKAKVDVLHIADAAFSEDEEKKLQKQFMSELRNRIVFPQIRIHIQKAADVVSGLGQFVEQRKADLLIMSHQQPYLLKRIFSPNAGVTRSMALRSHVPMLMVPDYYNPDYVWFWKLFELDHTVQGQS